MKIKQKYFLHSLSVSLYLNSPFLAAKISKQLEEFQEIISIFFSLLCIITLGCMLECLTRENKFSEQLNLASKCEALIIAVSAVFPPFKL